MSRLKSPKTSVRLIKFSLVGLVGIGVQLAVLAVLNAFKVQYLVATSLAVEAAILQNFLWHQRFTWIDRSPRQRHTLDRLRRFHVSNGLISFAGNLLVMKALVGLMHVPVLLANGAAIAACGLINFLVSDRWVFTEPVPPAVALAIAPASAPGCVAQTADR